MAFSEWGFILIPFLPCALMNISYTMILGFLVIFWCCNCLKTEKYKWFENLNSEVRSLLPLFKQGPSPNELLLFNFCVPNSRLFVLVVNCSVTYVVLVAAAIFLQTAFIEEAQCSPVNSNLFCYLNGSSVGCSEFDYSLETANCYGITVRFGDAAKNGAGVFSFYIIAFGLVAYIALKAFGGNTRYQSLSLLTMIILYYAFLIPLNIIYLALILGVGYSAPNIFQEVHRLNYIQFMFNVAFTTFCIPWWEFKKVDEERRDENETQRLLQAS